MLTINRLEKSDDLNNPSQNAYLRSPKIFGEIATALLLLLFADVDVERKQAQAIASLLDSITQLLVFRCRNQTAPNYLARDLQWADTDDSRRRLRSATTQEAARASHTTTNDRRPRLRRCCIARLERPPADIVLHRHWPFSSSA